MSDEKSSDKQEENPAAQPIVKSAAVKQDNLDDNNAADNVDEGVDITEDAGEGGCVAKAERISGETSMGCDTRSTISATGCEWTMALLEDGTVSEVNRSTISSTF